MEKHIYDEMNNIKASAEEIVLKNIVYVCL